MVRLLGALDLSPVLSFAISNRLPLAEAVYPFFSLLAWVLPPAAGLLAAAWLARGVDAKLASLPWNVNETLSRSFLGQVFVVAPVLFILIGCNLLFSVGTPYGLAWFVLAFLSFEIFFGSRTNPAARDFRRLQLEEQSGLVFNDATKAVLLGRASLAGTAAAVALPLPFVVAAHRFSFGEPALWAAYACAFAATVGLLLLFDNWQPFDGASRLEAALRDRFAAETLPVSRARFVGLGTQPSPAIYDGYTFWDIGLLLLTHDSLIYLGERARFKVSRQDVTEARLYSHGPLSLSYRVAGIHWCSNGQRGTFSIQGARSDWRDLFEEEPFFADLHLWLHGELPAAPAPHSLIELPSPNLPNASFRNPYSFLRVGGFLSDAVPFGLAALVVSLLLQLPFELTAASPDRGWHLVVCVTRFEHYQRG